MTRASAPGRGPEISVIFTLHDQRVEAERCAASWSRQQSFARDRYEVIVVSDGADRAIEEQAERALSARDRLLRVPDANMMELYHRGAQAARADLLLFTEFHCIARPDCLEKLARYMAGNPLDGACLHSEGDDTNAFARVERRLFEESFRLWSQPGDWRKVLVRGFAIRREAYFAAGGFDVRFAYFSDWALAAELHARGFRLGYAADTSLLHYYNTEYSQFVPAVRARAIEECQYRLTKSAEFCARYFGTPLEWQQHWWSRPDFRRLHFSALSRSIVRALFGHGHRARIPSLVGAWLGALPATLLGHRGSMARARLGMIWGRVLCALAWPSEASLRRAYLYAYRNIDRYYRLRFIQGLRAPLVELEPASHLDMREVEDPRLLGFFAGESWQGRGFRWCGAVAVVRTGLARGSWSFELEALDVRGPLEKLVCDVFADDRAVEDLCFSEDGRRVGGSFEVTGPGELVLTCAPLGRWRRGRAERRPLGIPVCALRFRPA